MASHGRGPNGERYVPHVPQGNTDPCAHCVRCGHLILLRDGVRIGTGWYCADTARCASIPPVPYSRRYTRQTPYDPPRPVGKWNRKEGS